MLARRGDDAIEPLPNCRSLRCARAGLGVGLLTGFIGAGGGFLLVPAMILFARLPMAVAAGTSLAVTASNSLAGWLGHLGHERFCTGNDRCIFACRTGGHGIRRASGRADFAHDDATGVRVVRADGRCVRAGE